MTPLEEHEPLAAALLKRGHPRARLIQVARRSADARGLPGEGRGDDHHRLHGQPRRRDGLGSQASRDARGRVRRRRDEPDEAREHGAARCRHSRDGRRLDEAKAEAERFAANNGVLFVDGLEREQYDGYSAIGKEILEQAPERPAAVVVPVGNGALIGGIGIGICEPDCDIERIGVVAKAARAWPLLKLANRWNATSLRSPTAWRCGSRSLALEVLGEVVTRMLQVSEREIAHAVGAYADIGIRARARPPPRWPPSLSRRCLDPLVLVVTGCNIDDDLFTRAVEAPETFPD